MLQLIIQHSAAENEAVFMSIVGPLLGSLACYYFLKRKSNSEGGTASESISYRAKIGAYTFGALFFIAFLVGVYKGIKFFMD